ncbi:PGF-CTERM sorting domain-containing protein [Haloplanus halophilus]|uniref:PGF-CTERM sorting domain-containing protein n=1 Tax=Haloplanus halophilus TaxID=2949993 RepID=UPI00203E0408|nr:PGF-CTERM sorting domain-containing protein [Haloplanus sp. GDY1]
MFDVRTVFVAVLLVASVVVPVGGAAAQQGDAYAGTHVEFETTSDAIVDYSVNGDTVIESVKVQSESAAESQGTVGVDAGLSAVTELTAAAVALESNTQVGATVSVESGATMRAHDNSKGVLVVRSGGSSQYVTANVSAASQADAKSDSRVVVTSEDGTTGTFLVVGDGSVTVNERGDVAANLGSDGKLVFRSYPQGRDDADRNQERLITEGQAAAEVYLVPKTESGGDLAVDVVQYGEETTVEVTQRTEGTVEMTAERSSNQGTVVITTVSERAMGSVEDLQVTVDGEAAARASSYSELRSTVDGGDSSAFLVEERASAQANADVLVAVNHFSERRIAMQSDGGDGGDAAGGSDDGSSSDDSSGDGDAGDAESTGGNGPGFGAGAALAALLGAALIASRRV